MDLSDVIIHGITSNGKAFRPGDWAERLCGVVGVFDPAQQMTYAPLVRQIELDGVKCVVVRRRLEQLEPRFFRFLLDFARDNGLQMTPKASPELPSADPVNLSAT